MIYDEGSIANQHKREQLEPARRERAGSPLLAHAMAS